MKLLRIPVVAVLLVSSMLSHDTISDTDVGDRGDNATTQSLGRLPADLNQHQFKVFLFDSYFDTYRQYRELDKSRQRAVYDYYRKLEGTGISDIDARIRDLM